MNLKRDIDIIAIIPSVSRSAELKTELKTDKQAYIRR